MHNFLDFEKPIAELEAKIEELRHLTDAGELNVADEVAKLQARIDKILRHEYARLSAWQKVQVARHPDRPHFRDYVASADRRFHAAGRRPGLCRRPRHHRRLGAFSRPVRRGHRS